MTFTRFANSSTTRADDGGGLHSSAVRAGLVDPFDDNGRIKSGAAAKGSLF